MSAGDEDGPLDTPTHVLYHVPSDGYPTGRVGRRMGLHDHSPARALEYIKNMEATERDAFRMAPREWWLEQIELRKRLVDIDARIRALPPPKIIVSIELPT